MTEHVRGQESEHGVPVNVEPITESEVEGYVDFLTGIITDSPYYTDEEKESLLDSASVDKMKVRLADSKIQMLQAKDATGIVVGFAFGRVIDYEQADLTNVGYVSWIGVSEEVRGQGVAGKLVDQLELGFKSHGVELSTCFIKNVNAASRKRFDQQGYNEDSRFTPDSFGPNGKIYSKVLNN